MQLSVDIADPEFRAWFEGSRIVDSDAEPLLVFRGEHGERDSRLFQHRVGSITFADFDSARRYAESPNDRADSVRECRVMPVYLKIARPFMFEPEDPYLELSTVEKLLGREEAVRVALKFESWIRRTDNWCRIEEELGRELTVEDFLDRYPRRLTDLYFLAYLYFDDPEETAKLKAAGFDGAVHAGSSVTAEKPEYKVFGPDSVWRASERWLTPDEAEEFVLQGSTAVVP